MERQLPEAPEHARVFNAAVMELGAVVCTARAPRCEACPIADLCAWRAAGYPEYDGARRAVQKKYEGSDRQVRGLILGILRDSTSPLRASDLESAWPEPLQRGRALDGLLVDGLVVGDPVAGYALPSG
jgi:A/G-specific adenine glycosylase